MIWANLLHLSFNMWEDRIEPRNEYSIARGYRPYLQFEDDLWDEILRKMSDVGMNMVVIDLGDGVKYTSHPEIAVENAWSVARLKSELGKIRDLGLEVIPKLNFATTHDAWLGEYSRCVSTPRYYAVCTDLIAEVIDLFGKPRFFHIGMDEETTGHQQYFQYLLVRQYELYWHDFHFYCDEVARGGSRPWIWSDKIWRHPEEFLKEVGTSLLQSNWYYGTAFEKALEKERRYVLAYGELEKHGYKQIPTASNHSSAENFDLTVRYCTPRIDPSRLLGFMQTPWRPTIGQFRERHMEAIEQVGAVIRGMDTV